MDLASIANQLGQFAPAFGMTLWLSAVSLSLSVPLTLAIASGLAAAWPPIHWIVDALINIPLVIKAFVCFYLLQIDPMLCAVIAIVLHQSAFAGSILSGGLREVPSELEEAALLTGLSTFHAFLLIRLPMALRMVAPALILQAAEIVKNSSIASLIGIFDLTASVDAFQARTFSYTQGFLYAALGYAVLTLPLMALGTFWERRLSAAARK